LENLILSIDEIKDEMLENGDTLGYDMIHAWKWICNVL
jgi:hypothetical protein